MSALSGLPPPARAGVRQQCSGHVLQEIPQALAGRIAKQLRGRTVMATLPPSMKISRLPTLRANSIS